MQKLLLATTAIGLISLPAVTVAQEQQDQAMEPAQECLDDLRTFGARVNDEGYWITGYRGASPGRYGVGGAPVDATGAATPAPMAGPYGEMRWDASPSYELRAIYSAAHVYGLRGEQERCQMLLSDLEQLYGVYSGQLAEAGVEPATISTWRQDQIAQATPVAEWDRIVSVEDVIGTEVRNGADEYLGEVENVVLHPNEGGISHVLVEYGGFLGLGEAARLVPWDMVMATPGLDTLVLNVSEEDFEDAPSIDPSELTESDQFDQMASNIEDYWRGQTATE